LSITAPIHILFQLPIKGFCGANLALTQNWKLFKKPHTTLINTKLNTYKPLAISSLKMFANHTRANLKDTVFLDGNSLTVQQVYKVACFGVKVVVEQNALEKVEKCHDYLLKALKNKTIYGVNTGFGSLATTRISDSDASQLQENMIRSHSAAVGSPLPKEVVRAAMLLRLNTLAKGYSGVRVATLRLLEEFLNREITPVVPETGSLGASGDLAQLAHIALAMMGEGYVYHKEEIVPSRVALEREALNAFKPAPKEGLALVNGTQMTVATACLCVIRAKALLSALEDVACLTIEALGASTEWLNEWIHALRPIPGQVAVAQNMRRKLQDSKAIGRNKRVQEAYSIRCIPQVHGAALESLEFCERLLSIEINSVSDNPLIVPEEELILSGGNFHAQPIAMLLDLLPISLTPLGALCERRLERLLNPAFSGLPAYLTSQSGLNSGYMLAQYTAASLVSENRVLCHPASVDTAIVSNGQEDHASMGLLAGKKALKAIENLWRICAIEALCASQAVDLASIEQKLGGNSRALYERVRSVAPKLEKDQVLSEQFEALYKKLFEHYTRAQAL
jgi:histidine ammonia-lyase